MSVRHVARVADITGLSPTCKLMMYGLAVNAGPDGHAVMNNEQLRHATGLSERTVRSVLADLEKRRLITRGQSRLNIQINDTDNQPLRWPVQ